MDRMFVSPQIHTLNPSPHCASIWRWGLWNGVSSLTKQPQRAFCSVHVRL